MDTSSSPSGPATPALDQSWPLPPPQGPARLEQAASLLRLDGPDSLRFLHGQSSQDLQLAQPGQWRRSCCLTPTARVTALVEVLADAGGAWLVITSGDGALVRQQLDRVLFPADQVTLGPLEPVRLIERLPAPAAIKASEPGDVDERWIPIAADPNAGFQLGQELLVLRGGAPLPTEVASWPTLAADDAEAWRIRQGRAAEPGELNGETNPFELGLAERVSLSKGCYVGQETLARLVTYDGIKQQLRRWHWQGPAAQAAELLERLQPGQGLISATGERAGRITSRLHRDGESPGATTRSDASVLLIGLALVRRGALEESWLTPTADSADDNSGVPGADSPRLRLSVPVDFSLPGT